MESLSTSSTVRELAAALRLQIPDSATTLPSYTLLAFGLGTLNLEGLDTFLQERGWALDAEELPTVRLLWVHAHKLCTAHSASSGTAASALQSSWSETFPPKLSSEVTLQLKRDFEKAYPSEVLDDSNFPSARLLFAGVSFEVGKGLEIYFMEASTVHRLSKQQEEDYNANRPRKLARFENFADVLYDDVPSRNIADNMGLFVSISLTTWVCLVSAGCWPFTPML